MSTTPNSKPSAPLSSSSPASIHQQSSTTSSSNASTRRTSTNKPIDILPNSISHIYTHLHPLLLVSLCYVGFPALVADPVSTLLRWAPIVATLQFLYCVICLPSTNMSDEPVYRPGQKRKKPSWGEGLGARFVPALLALLLTLTLSTPIYTLILILFGAPLTTHHAQTALLALLLSLLSFPPLFYSHGLHPLVWRNLASFRAPLDEVYTAAIGSAVGAWLGAIPIPLDWDRAWQVWPVTVVVGAFAGGAVGKTIGGFGVVRKLGDHGGSGK